MSTQALKLAGAVVVATLTFSACSDSDFVNGNESSTQVLDTAQTTSEVEQPFAINDGAFRFNDTSETSSPIAINK